MKKILLITTLLSIAMSENILIKNLRPKTVWFRDKQFLNRITKRIPQDEVSSEVKEFLNYDDDEQLSQISDTRFISEPRKEMLPSVAVIRRPDVGQFSQVKLLSTDKSKTDSVKPTVMISIDIREKKADEACPTKKNYRKHNQDWQIQQPFYVEEPRWIEVSSDYADSSSRYLNGGDPYILSRGKKIFKIKNPKQLEKIIEDYEELIDYPNRNKKPMKNRVRRSVEMNEKSQNNIIDKKDDQKEQIHYYNSLHNIDKDTKNTAMISMENWDNKFSKMDKQKLQHEDISNDTKNDNNKTEESGFTIDVNKRNKRSALVQDIKFPEDHKKHKTHETHWMDANSIDKDVEKNEKSVLEEIKNEAYIGKLDDLSTNDDSFILSRENNSFNNKIENSSEKDTNHQSIKRPWKVKRYKRCKKTRNDENKSEINEDNIDTTDWQLKNKFDAKSSDIKNYPLLNYRKKRNACKDLACKITSQQHQLQLSLERRNKQSDFLEDLKLNEPYIISRGKKASHEIEDNLYSTMKSRYVDDTDKIISLPIMRNLLKMLLMTRWNKNNGGVNMGGLSNKMSLRHRRGSLDDILAAAYDPYYVARGKRTDMDNFLTETQLLENQKRFSFEINEME